MDIIQDTVTKFYKMDEGYDFGGSDADDLDSADMVDSVMNPAAVLLAKYFTHAPNYAECLRQAYEGEPITTGDGVTHRTAVIPYPMTDMLEMRKVCFDNRNTGWGNVYQLNSVRGFKRTWAVAQWMLANNFKSMGRKYFYVSDDQRFVAVRTFPEGITWPRLLVIETKEDTPA